MGKALAGVVLCALAAGQTTAQEGDPAYPILERAYSALRAGDYDAAIAGFERALALAPDRVAVRKDLGYTLLKVGENLGAREQFGVAMKSDPADDHLALEYAFLCYETGEPIVARRIFDRLRKTGNQVAAQAFENVDRPLREGIARWQEALAASPENFSAHEELARLAERRDEHELAAAHYERAWRLRPSRRDLLLDLGRVWREMGRAEQAAAALLAASRGAEPRTAELARALLPDRYPYVYEFENALALDPENAVLRRELAYLHEAMGNREAFEREIEQVPDPPPAREPKLTPRPRVEPVDAKLMAERSLDKGYLHDALRYLHAALEDDPADFGAMLQLGWTYNTLQQDREAMRWFDLARQSADPRTAAEATRAYSNLAPAFQRLHTTVWMFPMISTRWRNTFAYAQAKAALHLDGWPVRPYASLRFIGDLRGRVEPVAGLAPQYLSERSVIAALGLSTPAWKGATLWFEAGQAIRYVDGPGGRSISDYRGGMSFARMARLAPRWFAETNDDAVFVSRFGRDTLFYSMNRVGRSFGESTQVYWNANLTADTKREYWANFVETGPGVRATIDGVRFSVDLVRGSYLINQANPFRPNYTDLRIGVWYAFGN